MNIIVTGSAGFIGAALVIELLKSDHKILGIDNHNDYYDINLKNNRVDLFNDNPNYFHNIVDLVDEGEINKLFSSFNPDIVINLAAQAGVGYSKINPRAYLDSNISGFFNILEASRKYKVKHLIYASSSSVYGSNSKLPFSENDRVDNPVSFYAASKRSNELLAHVYTHLHELPTTGLRFFTVYGPWGRPDMALFKFTHAILNAEPIDIYNHGNHMRDFTYIDDIVSGILAIVRKLDYSSKKDLFNIYNIGNSKPIHLMEFIETLEQIIGIKAKKNFLPLQTGDVLDTYADTQLLKERFGYNPKVEIKQGLKNFYEWYKEYYV